jgi:hypothetical protein
VSNTSPTLESTLAALGLDAQESDHFAAFAAALVQSELHAQEPNCDAA